jgi:hypothetical protein
LYRKNSEPVGREGQLHSRNPGLGGAKLSAEDRYAYWYNSAPAPHRNCTPPDQLHTVLEQPSDYRSTTPTTAANSIQPLAQLKHLQNKHSGALSITRGEEKGPSDAKTEIEKRGYIIHAHRRRGVVDFSSSLAPSQSSGFAFSTRTLCLTELAFIAFGLVGMVGQLRMCKKLE